MAPAGTPEEVVDRCDEVFFLRAKQLVRTCSDDLAANEHEMEAGFQAVTG